MRTAKPDDLFGPCAARSRSDEPASKSVALAEKKGATPHLRVAAVDGDLTDEQRAWVADYEAIEREHWSSGRFTPGSRK